MKNPRRQILWLVIILGLAVTLAKGTSWLGLSRQAEVLSYSDFIANLNDGSIQSVKVERHRARGSMKRPGNEEAREYVVQLPQSDAAQGSLIQRLTQIRDEKGSLTIDFPNMVVSETLQNLVLPVMVPILLLGVLYFVFIRQAQSTGNQAFTFGRSKAKRLGDNVPKVTFEDVAGVDEAKVELQEVVEFLKNPKKFQALGARIPKGVLLLGPPGCGKTLLARAVAGEAGVPFFHISGSDFVEMFVGVGASRVRDLFDTAKAQKPSLVFIDEIDAVGRQRGAGLGGGHDEREQTLNQLLVEMDGFDPNAGVILIAATNRPDVLDPALLRPGRFDRRVIVDNPDLQGRRKILDVHSKGKPLADDVNLEVLARRTPGFTGADLANMINEAALKAARDDKSQIHVDDFEAAIDRVVAGPERKSRVIAEKEKRIIAYHEVGHAIVQELLPHDYDVHKVTILPRGMALGLTWGVPPEERYLTSRSNLLAHITSLLAGRVAEELVFNEVHTGAANDLDRSSDLARQMVTEFGMSERLGPLKFGHRSGNPFLGRDLMEDRNYSEEVARAIDEEVRQIIDNCYRRATEILSERRELMDRIVEVLLERETLDRDEFLALMRGEALPAPRVQTPPPAPTPPGEAVRADEPSGGGNQPQLRARPEPV